MPTQVKTTIGVPAVQANIKEHFGATVSVIRAIDFICVGICLIVSEVNQHSIH